MTQLRKMLPLTANHVEWVNTTMSKAKTRSVIVRIVILASTIPQQDQQQTAPVLTAVLENIRPRKVLLPNQHVGTVLQVAWELQQASLLTRIVLTAKQENTKILLA